MSKKVKDIVPVELNDSNDSEDESYTKVKEEKIKGIKIMEAIKKSFIRKFEKIMKEEKVPMTIAGSFRRKVPASKDIDVVLLSTEDVPYSIDKFIKLLIKNYGDVIIRAKGDVLAHILVKYPKSKTKYFKMDISLANEKNYIPYLLHTTGPKELNIIMSQKAQKLGYKLSKNGLFKHGSTRSKKFKTERAIFKILGMDYINPKDRSSYSKPK